MIFTYCNSYYFFYFAVFLAFGRCLLLSVELIVLKYSIIRSLYLVTPGFLSISGEAQYAINSPLLQYFAPPILTLLITPFRIQSPTLCGAQPINSAASFVGRASG